MRLVCIAQIPGCPLLTALPLSAWEVQRRSCFSPRQGLQFLIAYGAVLREELSPGSAYPVPADQLSLSPGQAHCSVLVWGCRSWAGGTGGSAEF